MMFDSILIQFRPDSDFINQHGGVGNSEERGSWAARCGRAGRPGAWVAAGSGLGACNSRDGRPVSRLLPRGRPGLPAEPAWMATGTALDLEDEEKFLRPELAPPSISQRGDAPPACARAAVHLPLRRAACRRKRGRPRRRTKATTRRRNRTGERKDGRDGRWAEARGKEGVGRQLG
jgi:hypothetical protein